MFAQRINQTFLFWRNNLLPIFIVTLPFSLASVAIEHYWQGPIAVVDEQLKLNAEPMVATLILWALSTGALVAQLASIQAGQTKSLWFCLSVALRVGPLLLIANLLMAMAIGVGFMLFILPGIWLFARLSMTPFLLVLQQRTPISALKASFTMTEKHQLPLMLGMVVLTLGVFSLSGILSNLLVVTLALEESVALAIASPIYGLLSSLVTIFVFLFYLEPTE